MADVAAAAADALLRSILPAEPSRVSEFKVHLFSNMRMCCFEALTQKLKSCQQPKIVLPGDKVTETIQNLHTSARIGSTKSANTAVQCACMDLCYLKIYCCTFISFPPGPCFVFVFCFACICCSLYCRCMILNTATHFQAAVSNRMVERL